MDRVLIFVAGVDFSMVGMEIDGFKLKCSRQKQNPDDDDIISDHVRVYDRGQLFFLTVLPLMGFNFNTVDHDGNLCYLYFEKQTDTWESLNEAIHLINVLRLFQSSQIGFFTPMILNEQGGNGLTNSCPKGYPSMYGNAFPCEAEEFKCKDIELIMEFYFETAHRKVDSQISKMLDIYHDSFRMSTKELRLVQRVTLLEMLIEGSKNITDNLAKTVAKFLGHNKAEYDDIYEKMKDIYNARCRYLHDGNTTIIQPSIAQNALEFSRRVLANLLYLNCNMSEFRNKIKVSMPGLNPFRIPK